MSRARILVVAAVVVGAGAIALLVSLSPSEKPSSALTEASRLVLRGYDAKGRPAWTMDARAGAIVNDVSTLSDVELSFYQEGEVTLRARGTNLRYSGSEAVLTGNVEATSGDDYRLVPDELVWRESTHDLAATHVSLVSDTATVDAQGFRYNLEDGRWSISQGFTASLDRPSRLRVTGTSGVGEGGRLTLSGDLSITGENETYSCGEVGYVLGSEEATLSHGVAGTFSSGTLSADEVTLTSAGSTAAGGVHLVLDGRFFGGDGGA